MLMKIFINAAHFKQRKRGGTWNNKQKDSLWQESYVNEDFCYYIKSKIQRGSVCGINSFDIRYSPICKSPSTPSIFPFQASKTMKGEGTIG
nr:MAG TPA: hypothetical protein [Caudoviricetes sp.]